MQSVNISVELHGDEMAYIGHYVCPKCLKGVVRPSK